MSDFTEDLGCTPKGNHLYRKSNSAGGHIYMSDETGVSVVVWDTCLIDEGTLLAAMACEHHRRSQEYHKKRGWEPRDIDLEVERMAATGGSYLSPEMREVLKKHHESIKKFAQHKDQPRGDLSSHVYEGKVICLDEADCKKIGSIPEGNYIVHRAYDKGGWTVQIRRLKSNGKYDSESTIHVFHQCTGYSDSLLSVRVIGQMKKVFV